MTENQPPSEPPHHLLGHAGQSSGFLLRLIASSRYIFSFTVFGTFIVSVLLVIQGTVMSVRLVLHALAELDPMASAATRTEALEMVDIYLVATVLFVISMGFYQLLIRPNLPLPPWLRISSPAQLEAKLIGVLVTVMGVETLVQLNSWDGTTNLFAYGATAALVISALAFYTWAHREKEHEDDENE